MKTPLYILLGLLGLAVLLSGCSRAEAQSGMGVTCQWTSPGSPRLWRCVDRDFPIVCYGTDDVRTISCMKTR